MLQQRITKTVEDYGLALVIGTYSIIVLFFLDRLSLWLDEIIDLTGTKNYDFFALMEYVPKNSGGVPLGYLAQFFSIKLLGFSIFAARIPSALFSILGCVGLAILARRVRLNRPFVCVALFAMLPLQFRYAMEGRPYAHALCIGIWLTVCFFNLTEKPTWTRAFIYGLLILAGLYTQPFTLFVTVGHFLWTLFYAPSNVKKRLLFLVGAVALLALVLFIPWFFYARSKWVVAASAFTFTLNPKVPLIIFRELVGAGYIGSVAVLALGGLALRTSRLNHSQKAFWVIAVCCPILCALLVDLVMGYFLAIRQMIFVLPALAVLASFGLEELFLQRRRLAILSAVAVFGIMLYSDVRWFWKPRDDWQQAASLLSARVSQGACVISIPDDAVHLTAFFRPELVDHQCTAQNLHQDQIISVLVSPFASSTQINESETYLYRLGFTKSRVLNSQQPRVEEFSRQHSTESH